MASRTASSLAATLALLALASVARADEPSANDKSLAQSLFDEGRRLMDAGRYADACPRFADSERLDPGGGTVLNLALCYEKLGRLALAYSTYSEAVSLAIAERRAERESFARERIAALAHRVPHVTLKVADAPAGLVVRLDGSVVPASGWGTPAAVDPGEHAIDASAPERTPYRAVITVKEGEARDVPIVIASLPALPPAPAPVVVPPVAMAPSPAPAPPPAPSHVETRRSPAFYVVGGLGLASIAGSFVAGGIALSAHQSAGDKCNTSNGFCADPSGIDDASRARTFAWVSTAMLGGGLVATMLAFTLPLEKRVTVGVLPGGGVLAVGGAF